MVFLDPLFTLLAAAHVLSLFSGSTSFSVMPFDEYVATLFRVLCQYLSSGVYSKWIQFFFQVHIFASESSLIWMCIMPSLVSTSSSQSRLCSVFRLLPFHSLPVHSPVKIIHCLRFSSLSDTPFVFGFLLFTRRYSVFYGVLFVCVDSPAVYFSYFIFYLYIFLFIIFLSAVNFCVTPNYHPFFF